MEIHPDLLRAGSGLVLGLIFGFMAQRSKFCMVAAVSNLALMRDFRQFHAYLTAVAVALAGTALLEWGQWVDIAQSGYRRPLLNWASALGGGLIFGYGAMLAGGCASRTLVRCAEGNIGALVVLVAFALAGMASLFGVLEPVRVGLGRHLEVYLAAGDASASVLLGMPPWLFPLGLALLCLGLVFGLGDWRSHAGLIIAGAVIGLVIVAGWSATGILGQDEFDPRPPTSVSMAGPLARDALFLITGQSTGTLFALLLVPGVLLGAFGSALSSGTFRLIAPAGNRVGAYLAGGLLMGVGAVLAGGCNVGQGLSGLATASVSSMVAVAGILGGLLLGLRRLQRQAA
jgi:uncharacterized membrane protein YedE/YeeE